jgi:hypothetical protein
MESAYFNANPKYAALLGSGGLLKNTLKQYESYRIQGFLGKGVLFDSGELDWKQLNSLERTFRHSKERSPKWYFTYSYWWGSGSTKVKKKLYVRWNRFPTFSLSRIVPNSPAYSAIRRKARAAVARHRKMRGSWYIPSQAPVRPNPEIITTPTRRVFDSSNNGGIPSITTGSRTLWSRVWSGSRTPNFRKLKAKQLPVNPHSVQFIVVDSDDLFQHMSNHVNGGWTAEASTYTLYYNHPSFIASHLALARNKAIRKIIEQTESGIDANLAQDFAQYGQTVNLIRNSVTKITKSVLALKKGNIPLAINSLFAGKNPKFRGKGPTIGKAVAENWLELQYGWKPLLQDIEGSFKSLPALNAVSGFVNRATAVATAVDESKAVNTNKPIGFSGSWSHYDLVRTETRCKMTLRYTINSPLKTFLAQTGFTNPINLLWEVVPFSFVVDWFIPIGPWLETISSWDGLTFMDGSQTLFTRKEVLTVLDYTGQQPVNVLQEAHGTFHSLTIQLDRTRLSSFPASTFPQFKNGLASVTHALNGLALMRAAFK